MTLPLILGGAKVFAGLALVLLFAWARLLKEMDVLFFHKLFQEPWFILPFLGAIGGLSIAMMRGQRAVLSALRYILLLISRILTPITALFTITFLLVLLTKGTGAIFDRSYPGAIMIGLALAGMLIFNGVYQNGEGPPPPAWLRVSTLITLLGFPVYAGLAFYSLSLRLEEYGLTPPRIAGMAITGLVAAYSVVCIAGLITELNWRGRKWMPLVSPLNTAMAVLWVAVLTALATPMFNPWAMSAKSQFNLVANEQVSAADFDYGYMYFELGQYGNDALDELLSLPNHPQADLIREGVERARSANSRWEYMRLIQEPNESQSETGETSLEGESSESGAMQLELNPDDADFEDTETSEDVVSSGEDTDAG